MTIRDAFVPIALLGIIGSIVVPLPHALLDLMIIGNLVISIALLVSALQVRDPLTLSALPSILLVSTLYRLCLNISTTRLILSTGDAGETVEAFGLFVIGGSLGVGIVVFAVLTIVQFIVIAKGSERIAEVAARFTLDALPGKQMAIDADVRGGLYDLNTARQKREDLQTESRFFGALDGAMKFVKGDAIAALCIVVVNIVGGLVVGLLVEGLDAAVAARKYTVLTIGDGLASQIPSLLSSLAAGLVVTRVGRQEAASAELVGQLFQRRSVFFIVGGFSLFLAFVPHMPSLLLVLVATLILVLGAFHREKVREIKAAPTLFQPRVPPLLSVTVGEKTHQSCSPELLDEIRQAMFDSLGLLLPVIPISFDKTRESEIRLHLRGCAVLTWSLTKGEAFKESCLKTLEALRTSLIDDGQTRRLLDFHEGVNPEITSSVVPNHVSLTQLTDVLRDLLKERVSLRALDVILQGVAEGSLKGAAGRTLLEEVRIASGRVVMHSLFGDETTLRVWEIPYHYDVMFGKAERERTPLDISMVRHLIQGAAAIKDYDAVIVSRGGRKLVAECFELHGVPIPVLAYEEVPGTVTLERVRSSLGEEIDDEKLAA